MTYEKSFKIEMADEKRYLKNGNKTDTETQWLKN